MVYSKDVSDYSPVPRTGGNLGRFAKGVGTGVAGDRIAGAVVKVQLKISHDGFIREVRFRTHGCECLQAISSLVTEWITETTIEEALKIRACDIMRGFSVPPEKSYCASLLVKALRAAVADRAVRWGVGTGWWRCGFGQRWWRYW